MATSGPEPDEPAPERPRWIAWALVVFMVLVTLGVGVVGWRILAQPVAGSPTTAVVAARPDLAPAQALIESSDCMRCHGVERSYVGPSFVNIAQRRADRPGAQETLARVIREGGAGEWGRGLMPRHPQLSQEQALQMAEWVLAFKQVPAAGEGTGPGAATGQAAPPSPPPVSPQVLPTAAQR